MKKFRLEVTGFGLEIVYSRLTKKIFSYWEGRDLNDLSPDVAAGKDHPSEMVFIEDYDWSSRDDLGHFEGALFSHEAEISVYDASSGKKIWNSSLGEMNLPDEMQDAIDSDEFFIDSDEVQFYFQGKRIMSGTFYSSEFEANKFDCRQLSIKTVDVMGDALLTGISYGDIELEIGQNDLLQSEISLTVNAA